MIDRPKRDVLGEKLRHLVSSRIDNLRFDDLDDGKFFDSNDNALRAVFSSIWVFYDDFRSHSLRLTEGQRIDCVRCILFLQSDLEFEWPVRRENLRTRIRRVLTRSCDLKPVPASEEGECEVFPFFRRSDYEAALSNPKLLSGLAR